MISRNNLNHILWFWEGSRNWDDINKFIIIFWKMSLTLTSSQWFHSSSSNKWRVGEEVREIWSRCMNFIKCLYNFEDSFPNMLPLIDYWELRAMPSNLLSFEWFSNTIRSVFEFESFRIIFGEQLRTLFDFDRIPWILDVSFWTRTILPPFLRGMLLLCVRRTSRSCPQSFP